MLPGNPKEAPVRVSHPCPDVSHACSVIPEFFIEKSKRRMISEDTAGALRLSS